MKIIATVTLPLLRKFILLPRTTRSLFTKSIQSQLGGMNVSDTISQEELKVQAICNKVQRVGEGFLEASVKEGAQIIKSGGVIAVPTDTVYGLAADAQNNEAIDRIYKIKGRDFKKPIAICVASVEEVYMWGKVRVCENLLQELLPGPVTLVFERQPTLNPNLNPSTNFIGIRIPDNRFIVDLAKFHGGPIALTSANYSSCPSTLEVQEFKDLWPSVDRVFDGGRLSSCDKTEKAARAGSTVIDLSCDGFYRIIREGSALPECVHILVDKYKLKKQFESEKLESH